jgi:hypothetical protein
MGRAKAFELAANRVENTNAFWFGEAPENDVADERIAVVDEWANCASGHATVSNDADSALDNQAHCCNKRFGVKFYAVSVSMTMPTDRNYFAGVGEVGHRSFSEWFHEPDFGNADLVVANWFCRSC